MQSWVLKVQVDGEWEACAFGRREEAEATLDGLISDYGERVSKACLRSPQGSYSTYVPAGKQPANIRLQE